MAIEAEALLALSEKASRGEWRHCQPFMFVPAENTIHGRVPAGRVDYVSTWPGLGTPPGHRVIIPMEGRECHALSDDMAFIVALVNAYRDGSLIHRSALAEDTARAAEDGRWHVTARDGKPRYDGEGERWLQTWSEASATYDIACIDGDWSYGQEVDLLGMDAWRWLAPWPGALAPALPLTMEAADANR